MYNMSFRFPSSIATDESFPSAIATDESFPSAIATDESFPSAIATDESGVDDSIDTGVIFSVCLGGFGWYVSTVSNIALHLYWFLPVIAAGTVHFTCTISYCVKYCSMDIHCSIPISTHLSFQFNILLFTFSPPLSLLLSLSPLLPPPLQVSQVLMFCSTHLGSYSQWLCSPLA